MLFLSFSVFYIIVSRENLPSLCDILNIFNPLEVATVSFSKFWSSSLLSTAHFHKPERKRKSNTTQQNRNFGLEVYNIIFFLFEVYNNRHVAIRIKKNGLEKRNEVTHIDWVSAGCSTPGIAEWCGEKATMPAVTEAILLQIGVFLRRNTNTRSHNKAHQQQQHVFFSHFLLFYIFPAVVGFFFLLPCLSLSTIISIYTSLSASFTTYNLTLSLL